MSLWGHQLPLEANAERVRYAPISGPYLKPVDTTESCRYCCKRLFALVIKNSPGCRCGFRVKMWGTSSPGRKLTGDLGNVIEVIKIGDRRSDRLMAGKLSPGNFGLLQQYLPGADIRSAASLDVIQSPHQQWQVCPAGW